MIIAVVESPKRRGGESVNWTRWDCKCQGKKEAWRGSQQRRMSRADKCYRRMCSHPSALSECSSLRQPVTRATADKVTLPEEM